MKNTIIVSLLCLGLAVSGCAQQPKAANSSEAIKQASELNSVEEKTKYLVGQANAFINSKQFDEAVNTAKYVIAKLDQDSREAKGIIEKAKVEIEKLARQKAEELKGKLGNMGK